MAEPLLELRDLRLVQAIAERGGMTQAARVLHLTQSALSHQLRKLEDRLGASVFAREGRSLTLTPVGQRLIALGQTVLDPVSRVERAIVGGQAPAHQELCIATQCYTAYHWLPAVLKALLTAHPEIDVNLDAEMDNVQAALLNGKVTLGLRLDVRSDRALSAVPLFRDELVLVMPPQHPLAACRYVSGEQLSRETFISSTAPTTQRERVRKALFRDGKGFKRVLRVPNVEASLDLVQAGLGVAIAAESTLRKRVARGELVTVQLTERGLQRAWSALFKKKNPMLEPIQVFLDVLQQQHRTGRIPSG